MKEDSLKIRVQNLTGVPVADQKIWYNKLPITDGRHSLRRLGIIFANCLVVEALRLTIILTP